MNTEEIYTLFKTNFPYVHREPDTIRAIIGDSENTWIIRRGPDDRIISCAIIHRNTILFLFVEQAFRKQGIGTRLLEECETQIRKNGFDSVSLGAGSDYLLPGVPCIKKYTESVHENLLPELNNEAADFFEKRGYVHSWGKCNCFDMCMSLTNADPDAAAGEGRADDVRCRWAVPEDLEKVISCADDACQYQEESFSRYYKNPAFYGPGKSRVLVAEKDGKIAGCLIVSFETEGEGMGSVGCTCVSSKETHKGIGTLLVRTGTSLLKTHGMSEACLSYTYSGLDKMYGAAGYEITTYYFMGKKVLR
ncbi:MAG: GNAT family N-acetyltransferase [Clostridia bacterium]|nr:GNAT family N-acetyltransferase [Clostridia bacterium]